MVVPSDGYGPRECVPEFTQRLRELTEHLPEFTEKVPGFAGKEIH